MSSSVSSTLWIIHREARGRAALARIAGAGDNTVLGSPSDELFTSASAADVVLLAPSGDFESELEFVHRFSAKPPGCTWILLPEASDMGEAQRLFDNLPATFLRFPPQPDRLRRCISQAANRRSADSLSRRRGRDLLAGRFTRWFSDLDLPDLLRALDPKLSHLPLLIRGEPGTGRGIVARYVHAFGSSDGSNLLHIPCADLASEHELLDFIREAGAGDDQWRRTLWLEDVDRLPGAVQLRVRDWIEYGLPEGVLRSTRVRFVASAHDARDDEFDDDPTLPRLQAGLATALSGLVIELPPLRERIGGIETFVADSAFAWATLQNERQRGFSDAAIRELANYPWPGNMAQLEAVIYRSLSHSSADPLEPHHLRFQNEVAPLPEEALPTAEFVDDFETFDEIEGLDEIAGIEEVDEADGSDEIRTPQPEPFPVRDREPGFESPADFELQRPAYEPARAEPAQPPPSPVTQPAAHPIDDHALQRLVGALAHEVRNPLVSIRTFSELLPDHYGDEEFRERFAALVGNDVRQIETVVSRLEELAELRPAQREATDLPAIFDRVLERHASVIQDRHLLVLKELDRKRPLVLADRKQLERAFTGMFETALSMVPERGDVYLASKHNAQGLAGAPTVRVLLRYHNPNAGRPLSDILSEDGFRVEGITPSETALEYLIDEAIIAGQGGELTLDTTDAQETVIVIDLPAAV